ncbi:MAG TPA: tRNA (5-methylaminomethyl-2-thiouridine)(34)-methyltransferase MnmD [Mucilaginibacter sp.]|nr:tRNA (5-methylaminomethyl-2-thiouridine)(34)-methyltransferase MnmD [Mucilaginibacter sp.]
MNQNLTIVATADGSNTIYNPQVGENYHSRHGALQESRHVFLKSGLEHFLSLHPGQKSVSILEVGFGTGLNFLLTADFCAREKIRLHYTGIEAYPLTPEMTGNTGYGEYTPQELWQQFNEHYPKALGTETPLGDNCTLYIANCKLTDFCSELRYDLIYFDAFASVHQPEMWNREAIGHTIGFLKPGGVFVTYAITGDLKRMIKEMGCRVEKARGAPGKREMLRATKINDAALTKA